MSIESRKHQYGKVFGHWQIKEFLGSGSGGKSAVFRLEHTESSGVKSALKVISLIEERGSFDNLSSTRASEYMQARQKYSEQAEREVLLMNDLQGNTNIVDYLDHTFVDWSDETGYGRDMLIRMEMLSDLRSQINVGKTFTPGEILRIGEDISNALILCHKKGILHRDIKPENIFVNKDGNYKLGDFGISRIIGNTSSVYASTGIGTPQYWAPEQTSGEYNTRVDLYSLGLVLYELSNKNRLPFAESTYVQTNDIHRRLLGESLPAPCNADPALAQVILKACAYNADDRYQTAEELLTALQKLHAPIRTDSYATMPAQSSGKNDGYSTMAPQWEQPDVYSTMAPQWEQPDAYGTMPATPSRTPNAGRVTPAPISNTPKKSNHSKYKSIILAILLVAALAIVGAFILKPSGCKEHDWTDATCDDPRTCRECGETEGSPLEHRWKDKTCTTGETCIYCGKERTDALGHQWVEATCTTPKTCAICAATEGVPKDHTWEEPTCEKPKTCVVCDATEGSSRDHSWEDATCEQPEQCNVCGEVSGMALGHDWKDATFLAPKTCLRCKLSEGSPISYAHIHVESEVELIRTIYNDIESAREAGTLNREHIADGVDGYFDANGTVRCIVVYRDVDGIGQESSKYSRSYYYDGDKLIFAFYEGQDSHRLYFYNGLLMRWLYRSNDVSEYHDFDFTSRYLELEALAQEESRLYQ